MGADDYDAMRETIAALSDPALLLEHQVGAQAIVEGEVLNSDQLAEVMRNAGRSVDAK
jgi:hypothetical protein